MVPRMCEAHPCTDEPIGTSVAPNEEGAFMFRCGVLRHGSLYE